MNIFEVIKTRRSIKKYKPVPVPEEHVEKSSKQGDGHHLPKNSQPWKFIILRSKEVRKRLADAISPGRFLPDAPLGIAVTINPKASNHPVEDGAAATQNMILEAHSLGLGACWIGIYGRANEEKNEEEAKKTLKVPEEERLLSIIAIGYPTEYPEKTRNLLQNSYKDSITPS